MRVERRMKARVITIQRDESVDRAQTLMAVHAIRHLPVLDGRRLVGVISDRDVLGVMVQQRTGSCGSQAGKSYFLPPGVPVAEAMTPDPVVVDRGTDIEAAARLLISRKIGCLPVVDRGRVVGIITETDILGVFTEFMGLLDSSSRIDIALGRDPLALERTSAIIRRHRGRIVSIGISPRHGATPRVHHFRLKSCDTAPIADALRRAGFKVLERIG
jgi:acetoin utilization protein AcuB